MQRATHTHIRCRTIIEVLGKPKEHVEQTLKGYCQKIKQDEDYVIIKEDFSDAKEQEEELWSTFVELEFLVKGMGNLISFCFDYMPSSMEVVSPEEMIMPAQNINGLLNDLQARLHKVDMVVKQQQNENAFLRQNMSTSIKNTLVMSLASSSLDMDQLSLTTGMQTKEIKPFVDVLLKEGTIKKDGERYARAK